MKIIKNLAVVFALSATAFAATAADLSSQPTSDMRKWALYPSVAQLTLMGWKLA